MFRMPISARQIALILLVIVLTLSVAGVAGQYYKDFVGNDPFWLKVVDKLDLDLEANNLPTWYQSSTLLLSSFLLFVIALIRKNLNDQDARYWFVLALAFLYLSADEAVSIHEQLTMPLREKFHFEGFLYLSWVIPATIFLLFFAFTYIRFLFRLSARTRCLLIAAGVVYIFGAVGMEMFGAKYLSLFEADLTGARAFTYSLLTATEEFCEMFGILLLIYTLFGYLETEAFAPVFAGEKQPEELPEQTIVESSTVKPAYGRLVTECKQVLKI